MENKNYTLREFTNKDQFKLETKHGSYHVWLDYKNNCWVVDLANNEIVDTASFDDCLDIVKTDLKDKYSDETKIVVEYMCGE